MGIREGVGAWTLGVKRLQLRPGVLLQGDARAADRCGEAGGRPWGDALEAWTSQRLGGPRRLCHCGWFSLVREVKWGKGRRQDWFWTIPGAGATIFERVL